MNELIRTKIFWLAMTFLFFHLADLVSKKFKRHPLCHPVLLSVFPLMGLLLVTKTNYKDYYASTQALSFLLGPAIVGLAYPVWEQRENIKKLLLPLLCALFSGAIVAIISSVGIMYLFGAPQEILASIAPRATTTPVAMELSKLFNGIPALATAIVLLAGVVGAMTVGILFKLLKVDDEKAKGFALGITSHGFGAAKAFEVSQTQGTYASLGMALNAIATAILLSLVPLLL